MRVAVFGSWREGQKQLRTRGSYADFVSACAAIGKALAQRRQIAIVGGESPNTADTHVVTGIVDEANASSIETELIEVIRPDDDSGAYEQLASAHPKLFIFHSRSWGRWAEAHLVALDQADTVLTIGGGGGTLHVGLAAIIARKPLVPIASFGGASTKLMQALEIRGAVADIPEYRALNRPWTLDSADAVLRLLGVETAKAAGNNLPRVFIGSSVEGLPIAYEIQAQLRFDARCVVWNQGTVFGLGTATIEALEQAVSDFEHAVFVFTPDDQLNTRGQIRSVARDNVIFELGQFVGRRSRKRAFVVHPGGVSLPSDLAGLSTAVYDPTNPELASSLGPVCHHIRQAIKVAASRAL